MQNFHDLLFEIGHVNFISVLDFTKGFWQIPMKDEAKPLNAFVTHLRHYKWRVMPFDLKNSGSTFQKSMDEALFSHRRYCCSYIDDVAVFSSSWEDHLQCIAKVLNSFREIGLKISLKKCDFGKNSVKFLGHIAGSGKHSLDPEKMESIQKLSRPSTKNGVRSFLGLASYYRDYIPRFTQLVLPLTNLTKKNIPNNIPWDSSTKISFLRLKEELIKMHSLYTPVLERPFLFFTDASPLL